MVIERTSYHSMINDPRLYITVDFLKPTSDLELELAFCTYYSELIGRTVQRNIIMFWKRG